MRQYVPPIIAGLLAGAVPGGYAIWHKPAPTIVRPQTTVVQRAPQVGDTVTRSESRAIAASWGELDQKEIDVLSAALAKIERKPLTIFCEDDSRCGDMQLDFDNAFETAHWDTKLEKPLIDDTVGVATSSPELRDAINSATSGRLNVGIIAKNAPYEVLVIGKKGVKK